MQKNIHAETYQFKTALCTIFGVLALMLITGCSGTKKVPEQPFTIPFDSKHITTDKVLSVSTSLEDEGSSDRDFLYITQQTYYFENGNSTATVQVLLNRSAKTETPEIGEWSTVSTGNCLSDAEGIKCFTAHIDCHLVRTTFIPTGERSLTVIKVRNRAREPQELCEQWDYHNLTPNQQEEVEEFNKTSDALFTYELPKMLRKKRNR